MEIREELASFGTILWSIYTISSPKGVGCSAWVTFIEHRYVQRSGALIFGLPTPQGNKLLPSHNRLGFTIPLVLIQGTCKWVITGLLFTYTLLLL